MSSHFTSARRGRFSSRRRAAIPTPPRQPPAALRNRALGAVMLCLCIAAQTADAADIDGAADHPMVSRYPGQEIRWYTVENFRPYKVPVGPVTGYRTIGDRIETQGRVTRIFYAYEGERTHDEIWLNYVEALREAGFELLAEGAPSTRAGAREVGGRTWQGVALAANPWGDANAEVATMAAGTATQGGSAAVIATRERAAGRVYVVVNVEQHSDAYVGTLVDIVEVEAAETGLVVVDPEAMGEDIAEFGRVVLEGILFDHDEATIRIESAAALEAIARYLAGAADRHFYIVGHTDATGEFAYNLALSRDRARAVADALAADYGVDRARLEPHGVGPLVPAFSNGSDAGRERNRRVELVER